MITTHHALASQVITELADRLTSPAPVADRTRDSAHRAQLPGLWFASSMSTGHTGIATLHATLAGTRPGAASACYDHLRAASAGLGERSSATSTLTGVGAVGFAALIASAATGGYQHLIRDCLTWTTAATDRVLAATHDRATPFLDDRIWDAICGVTGTGRYLLAALDAGHPQAEPTLRAILELLVQLTCPVRDTDGLLRPGWWIVPRPGGRFPSGGTDAGLAHGITGPLALLALTRLAGIHVPGHDHAMRRIADWLTRWQLPDHRWPGLISPTTTPDTATPTRSAWCYGAAGVARTLYLAGSALADPRLSELGVATLRALAGQDPASWHLPDHTICHGTAGLLTITSRTAHDANDPQLRALADQLAARIVDGYDPAAAFGYRHHAAEQPERIVDVPGMLTGAAGIALALHTYLHLARTTAVSWEDTLLIS